MATAPDSEIAPHFHRRIGLKAADRTAPPVLIVALGDSVTQGITGVDQIAHEAVYHARFKRSLERRFPLTTFSVINAGVDGHTAGDGVQRLDRDVIRHQPDLVLVAFALNDAAIHGADGTDGFEHNLTRIVDDVRDRTKADVALVTPNMMLTRDNDAIPACYQQYTRLMLDTQVEGVLAAYAERVRRVAEARGAVLVDVYARWERLARKGVDTTAMLANGLNHPTDEAHAIAAEALDEALWAPAEATDG